MLLFQRGSLLIKQASTICSMKFISYTLTKRDTDMFTSRIAAPRLTLRKRREVATRRLFAIHTIAWRFYRPVWAEHNARQKNGNNGAIESGFAPVLIDCACL